MALVTSQSTLPDFEYEHHTIVVDNTNLVNSQKPNFTAFLPAVLENIVQVQLIAGNFTGLGLSPQLINLHIEQLNTPFSQYAKDTLSSTNQIKIQNLFGSFVTNNTTSYTFKNEYPIIQQYYNPIRKLDRLSIHFLTTTGAELAIGNAYLIFKFICKRRNVSY
tara:strand:+ start:163 stop:651 length:489 start_codon:yes stop_codon:yes gene_type:complete